MKQIYFFIFLIASFFAFSQNPSGLVPKKMYQVNTFDGGKLQKTVFDKNGNNIQVGYANGPYVFDGQQIATAGISDLYLIKHDKNTGAKIWQTALDAGIKGEILPSTIAVDAENKIYVVCIFKGQILINGQSFESSTDDLNYKSLLLKFSADGQLLWGLERGTSDDEVIPYGDYLLLKLSNQLTLLNKESGSVIRTKTFQNVRFSAVKFKNDQIFFSGRTNSDIQILGKTINRQNEIIVRTDLNFVEKAFVRIYPKNNPNTTGSAVRISDILVSDDDALYFTANYPSGTILSAENDLGIIVDGTNSNSSSSSAHLYQGKFNFDLSVPQWMKGNRFSIQSNYFYIAKLAKGRNFGINVVLNANEIVYYYNNTYKSFQDRGVISLSKDGEFTHFADNAIAYENNGSRVDFDYFSDESTDYIAYEDPNKTKSFIRKRENSEEDFTVKQEKTSAGQYGYLRTRELFKVFSSGEMYNSYITDGKIFNYFGQDNEKAFNNNIISKISASGTLDWKIKADGITDDYVNYWVSGHRIDINANKEIVSAFSCYRENSTDCKITDSQGMMKDFNYGTLISKFNTDGVMTWSKSFNYALGLDGFTYAKDFSIYQDSVGNIVLVGKAISDVYYEGEQFPVSQPSFFILKTDSNGNKVFFKSFPYQVNSLITANFDSNNNIYLFFNLKEQTTTMQFDSVSIPQNGENPNKFIFLKLNQNGNVLAARNYLSNENNYREYINTTAKFDGENFVVIGQAVANFDLKNQPLQNPYTSEYISTTMVSKISKEGDVLWSYPFYSGNDVHYFITDNFDNVNSNNLDFDADKNIYLIDFWRTNLNYRGTEIPMKVGANGLLFKLDASGNYLYSKYIDRPESFQSLSVYDRDKIAVVGNSAINKLLDLPLTDKGGFNNYVVFLEKEELATSEQFTKLFSVYPNPTSDYLNINTKEKISKVEIYDGAGRKMNIKINSEKQIDVKNLLKGVYYLRIFTDKNVLTSKFIKK